MALGVWASGLGTKGSSSATSSVLSPPEEPNLKAEDIRLGDNNDVLEDDEANFFIMAPRGASAHIFTNGLGGGDKKRKIEGKVGDYNDNIKKQQRKVLPEKEAFLIDPPHARYTP